MITVSLWFLERVFNMSVYKQITIKINDNEHDMLRHLKRHKINIHALFKNMIEHAVYNMDEVKDTFANLDTPEEIKYSGSGITVDTLPNSLNYNNASMESNNTCQS